MQIPCPLGRCEGFDLDIDQAHLDDEAIGKLMNAQSEHSRSCGHVTPEVTHIRKQIARKRGNGFYKVQYGPSENGSQTLCGAAPTMGDMSYGETRYPKGLSYVSCEKCKELR